MTLLSFHQMGKGLCKKFVRLEDDNWPPVIAKFKPNYILSRL
jgi:hypothetical protein